MSIEDYFDQAVDIQRPVFVKDEIGGTTMTSETLVSALPCRIIGLRGTERAMMGSIGVDSTHKMFCVLPTGATMPAERDHVILQASPPRDYWITWVNDMHKVDGVHHLDIYLTLKKYGGFDGSDNI